MKLETNFSALDRCIVGKDNVVPGVCVIKTGIAKGHDLEVDRHCLAQFLNCVQTENQGVVKTLLNHKAGIEAIAGTLENFYLDGNKVRADLYLLPEQKDFKHTKALIENLSGPGGIGLSASFVGEPENGRARVRSVISADLVVNPAVTDGLFSARFDDDETETQEDDMTNSDDVGEIIHTLLDHIDSLESEVEQLREALEIQDDDDVTDQDPVIQERGAAAGPHDYRSALQTHDFESRIEAFKNQGLGSKAAHIAALKEFARSKYETLNL